jgi:GTP:adenosylcobinamide-phosphate guanylyltransferase
MIDTVTNKRKESIRQVDALVLAGGDGEVIDPGVAAKGLVKIAGKPMVQWVLEALRAAKTVREIAVVIPAGSDTGGWEHLADYLALSNGSFVENITAGVDALKGDIAVAGVTSDIPTLVPEAIDDLVEQTFKQRAAVSYPLISEEDLLAAYPGSERTFVKIRGGRVTGGNVMVFAPHVFERMQDLAQQMFEARKSPVKMARIVGPVFVTKMMSGQLNPRDVEKRLNKLLGVKCAAIYTRYPCIGADVDKPADIAPAENALRGK